jgi:hypothetical protein
MLLLRRAEAGMLFALPVAVAGDADSLTMSPTTFPATVWAGALTAADSMATLSPLKRALLLLPLYPSEGAVGGTVTVTTPLAGRSNTLDVTTGTGSDLAEVPPALTLTLLLGLVSISTARPSIMADITW